MRHKIDPMRYVISLCVCMGVLWGHLSVGSAQQQPIQVQPARGVASLAIVDAQGDAQVLTKAEAEKRRGMAQILAEAWEPAKPRTMLGEGDQLKTGARSSMKLQMADGTVVSIEGDSVVMVEQMRSARGETPQTTELKLVQGKVSTEQTTRILGQTNQIISTDNGSVNTRLGEVEVRKPAPVPQEYAMTASLSPYLMYFAKKPEKDDTFVTLRRGTATIESFGKGRMITNSQLLPETCIGEDGIKFTLVDPKAQVVVSRLEDQSGYRLTSQEYFYLLVATEGTVNQVNVATDKSDAVLDIEGVEVAEQDADARSILRLHPLLTVGVKSADVTVNLLCDVTESRGINEFGIQGVSGRMNVLRTEAFGPGTERPDPARGLVSTPVSTPEVTPTLRPEDDDEWDTPTPTETPEEEETPPPPPPQRVPVTHSFPQAPFFNNTHLPSTGAAVEVTASGPSTASCIGPGQYEIMVTVHVDNYLPTLENGTLVSRETNDSWVPQATFSYSITDPGSTPWLIAPYYDYTWPMEAWSLRYYFCYIPPATNPNSVYFQVRVWDSAGNASDWLNCTGPVPGTFTCNP